MTQNDHQCRVPGCTGTIDCYAPTRSRQGRAERTPVTKAACVAAGCVHDVCAYHWRNITRSGYRENDGIIDEVAIENAIYGYSPPKLTRAEFLIAAGMMLVQGWNMNDIRARLVPERKGTFSGKEARYFKDVAVALGWKEPAA